MTTNWYMYIQRISLDLANVTCMSYKPFYTNRMINVTANYNRCHENQHERKKKTYINTHLQMQIAGNISTDLVNLFG